MTTRKKEGKILKDTSPSLHFKELIDRVKTNQNLHINDFTQFYIVDLLSRFLLTQNLFLSEKKKFEEEPLALKLYRALEERSIEEKIAILKQIGDVALYISGFFSESLAKKIVDIDYYISMGEGAYGAASELAKRKENKEIVVDVFKELSVKFKKIVDLLTEVSELSELTTDKDLIRIYEKWTRTKSPRLKKKLIEKGIIPVFRKIGENNS